MKSIKVPFFFLMLVFIPSLAQTKIETKDGLHYITTRIEDYSITGTYLFKGAEPTVELNGNGSGLYQGHEQAKKAIIWGIECDDAGVPLVKKGYDNLAYTLWYQYTTPDPEDDPNWIAVEFSIHLNSQKMFINGERCKEYSETASK